MYCIIGTVVIVQNAERSYIKLLLSNDVKIKSVFVAYNCDVTGFVIFVNINVRLSDGVIVPDGRVNEQVRDWSPAFNVADTVNPPIIIYRKCTYNSIISGDLTIRWIKTS